MLQVQIKMGAHQTLRSISAEEKEHQTPQVPNGHSVNWMKIFNIFSKQITHDPLITCAASALK